MKRRLPPAFLKKKKKAPPFQSNVEGAAARHRPDRKARGGAVSKAYGERQDPDERTAPEEGAVKQKFQVGGRVSHAVVRDVAHGDPMRHRSTTVHRVSRDPAAGGYRGGGKITTAQRKALPSGDFALPGKGKGAGGKGPGSYPIDTENRARNALARGAQHAGPGELATIKRKVKAKYPDIDVGGE
jgi:hypothetical protein